MNKLSDLFKGNHAWYVPSQYNKETPRSIVVTKLTPEFIYCADEQHNKYKFEIKTGFEIVRFGGSGCLYFSQEDYDEMIEKNQLIKNNIIPDLSNEKISLEHCVKISDYIKKIINE